MYLPAPVPLLCFLFTADHFEEFTCTECLPVLINAFNPLFPAWVVTTPLNLLWLPLCWTTPWVFSSSWSLPFYLANYSLILAVLYSFGLLHITSSWASTYHFGSPFSVSISQVALGLQSVLRWYSAHDFKYYFCTSNFHVCIWLYSFPWASKSGKNDTYSWCLIDLSPLIWPKGFLIPFLTLSPSAVDLPDLHT